MHARGPQLTRGFPLHRSGRSAPTQSGAGRAPAAGPGLTLAVGLLPVRGDGRRWVLLVLLARSVVLLLHVEALVALHLPHLKATSARSGSCPELGPGWLPPAPRAGAGRAAQAAPGLGGDGAGPSRNPTAPATSPGGNTGQGHGHRDRHRPRTQTPGRTRAPGPRRP